MKFDNRGMRYAVCGLLVLLLSIFMTGCVEDFDPTVPAACTSALTDFGFTGTLQVPDNTEYNSYGTYTNQANEETFYIIWTEADSSKFSSYKTKWGNKVDNRSINSSLARAYTANSKFYLKDIGDDLGGEAQYTSAGGTLTASKIIPENSIVLLIYED